VSVPWYVLGEGESWHRPDTRGQKIPPGCVPVSWGGEEINMSCTQSDILNRCKQTSSCQWTHLRRSWDTREK
jgi:hypothetical protein